MMTVRMELESPLQDIIDERLDAIDRVLLRAGVSRGERRRIVEEVEAQVHELLARRNPDAPSRADVAAVLDSLDPPEAYAPEEYRHRLAAPARAPAPPRVPQPSLLALGGAAGGVLMLLLTVLGLGLVVQSEGGEEVLLFLAPLLLLGGAAVTACGIAAIRRIRGSGGWLFGLPAALFAAAVFPVLLLNGLVVAAVLLFEEYGLIAGIAVAFLVLNGLLVHYLWRSVSAGYRRATPEAR